eukprot:5967821-Pleurochrysis_carterae.AAC.1
MRSAGCAATATRPCAERLRAFSASASTCCTRNWRQARIRPRPPAQARLSCQRAARTRKRLARRSLRARPLRSARRGEAPCCSRTHTSRQRSCRTKSSPTSRAVNPSTARRRRQTRPSAPSARRPSLPQRRMGRSAWNRPTGMSGAPRPARAPQSARGACPARGCSSQAPQSPRSRRT